MEFRMYDPQGAAQPGSTERPYRYRPRAAPTTEEMRLEADRQERLEAVRQEQSAKREREREERAEREREERPKRRRKREREERPKRRREEAPPSTSRRRQQRQWADASVQTEAVESAPEQELDNLLLAPELNPGPELTPEQQQQQELDNLWLAPELNPGPELTPEQQQELDNLWRDWGLRAPEGRDTGPAEQLRAGQHDNRLERRAQAMTRQSNMRTGSPQQQRDGWGYGD